MGTLLARNADVLVTMDRERRELRNAGLFARDGIIEQVGPTASLPGTADVVLNLAGHVLLPGLINCHHHLDQILTRNLPAGQNTNLFPWLMVEALYNEPPYGPAVVKEIDHINQTYRKLIEAAPFFALATCGPDGLDCSPRGDPAGFVRVLDEKTIAVPDRRGNNRIDSLRNLIHDPRVALLFMIPGVNETLRIIGRAEICTEPQLCGSFTIQGKAPRAVLLISVDRVYFQCAKALVRSKLWDPATRVDRSIPPTSGAILAEITDGKMGGPEHDRTYPERVIATIY